MNCGKGWPEPIVRVQSLSDSGAPSIPDRYIKLPSDRPSESSSITNVNIPVIDFSGLKGDDRAQTLQNISEACKEWGFFQAVNHGVSPELMDQAQQIWREFFHQPMEVKQSYANLPATYEGYGSRLGVHKGAILDWSDYYYLHYLPSCLLDHNKWPALPSSLREVVSEYSRQVVKFGGELMKVLSINLGLSENHLQNAFGGEDIGACLRVNFYPKCPQPDLTLGLSSHSDPGGLTFLLPDQHVVGLQVRKGQNWITVKPTPHAFIVNIGDQIQVLSNTIYKSVEHRVIVNSNQERISLAFFYNPKSDLPIEPVKELVTPEKPAMYTAMSFDEYRLFIRTRGPQGKSQIPAASNMGCQQSSCSEVEVVTIDVRAAKDVMLSGNHRYLDVRTQEEFKNGHVDVNNIINIPYMFETPEGRVKNPKFMEQVLSTFEKNDNIIVGCQSGIRFVYATMDLLKSSEFKKVYNMGGGYSAWVDNNLAVKIPGHESETKKEAEL